MGKQARQMVPIPKEKGVHIKAAGAKREKYVYQYVKYFRNEDGKPRNRAKLIGKAADKPGMMIPNRNYFEMFHVEPSIPHLSVWDYGFTYLVEKICQRLGLSSMIEQVFGSAASSILAIATFLLRDGGALDGMEDWQERTFLEKCDRVLTSQEASRIFESITHEKRMQFFRKWIPAALTNGTVCYDVTSISSYAQNMPSVERGYNRDHEDLCQYNLGMFCDETTRMPLYYERYEGSLTDRSNLSYVLANAADMGPRKVKLVLDGGFWSKECIQSLGKSCDCFTMGMPSSLNEASRAIEQSRSRIEQYRNKLSGYHVYCVEQAASLHGVEGRILVYYDPLNHACLVSELSDSITRMEAELSRLKRYPKSKLARFRKYFKLTKHEEESGFDYEVDVEKVEKLSRNKGFFLLFTTDKEAGASDLLYFYRAKDADEKIFGQIKNEMSGKRIRTHNERTTDGKTFVIFLACLLRSYLLGKLQRYLSEQSTSLKKVWSQLSNILMVECNGAKRLAKALTKKQKDILSIFGVEKEILAEFK